MSLLVLLDSKQHGLTGKQIPTTSLRGRMKVQDLPGAPCSPDVSGNTGVVDIIGSKYNKEVKG